MKSNKYNEKHFELEILLNHKTGRNNNTLTLLIYIFTKKKKERK